MTREVMIAYGKVRTDRKGNYYLLNESSMRSAPFMERDISLDPCYGRYFCDKRITILLREEEHGKKK